MNQLTQSLLLSVFAALGLDSSQAREVQTVQASASCLAPLTAIYRCLATPEATADIEHWLHTRSGTHGFSGTDAVFPRASASHAELLRLLARCCAPGGCLPAGRARAEAFGYEFTRHAPAARAGPEGLVEVWWSSTLELPLVIVRQVNGRTLVDELVHLNLEERAELLLR